MTTFRVMYQGQAIGTSALEHHDPNMGIVHGRFHPSGAYEDLRSVFRLFSEATAQHPENKALLQEYYRQRDALEDLSLITADGEVVGTSVIGVLDDSHAHGPDAYELEVGLQDAATYERYFSSN